MPLPKRYNPRTREPVLADSWRAHGVYKFDPTSNAPIYAIDTPPPTVSGNLHLGHTFSYSHTDFSARFWRMRGYNVYYPMGYDDNGLPTERLVEKRRGIRAQEVGREAFIAACLAESEVAEAEYDALWRRLGLSVDWRYSYRTIDERSRRIAQWSFIDLYQKGLAYRQEAPAIWCPTCQTAIAQAEVDDLDRVSEFVTLAFRLSDDVILPIATTRPELLPACVAVFVHPDDARYAARVGEVATVPLFGQTVPILADVAADPAKGTGAVMCCTFGDTTDVAWWRARELPYVAAIDRAGRLTAAAGSFAGMSVSNARKAVVAALDDAGLVAERRPTAQTIGVHERCDTPIEYIMTGQWFVRVLDHKADLLALGATISWQPAHMEARFRQWVENLSWDWCISRQRYFGVTFPLWYCVDCGHVLLADMADLPLDPTATDPAAPCPECGGVAFTPETDVMDTWATSSLSPQIAGQWALPVTNPASLEPGASQPAVGAPSASAAESLFDRLQPYALRPQAHDIIRTWAFYTLVKSWHHFRRRPWATIALSGWGLAPAGEGKISKSRGGGPVAPFEMIERYSADALRYWAASTGLGKDTRIDEAKMNAGARLATKLWNVARFSERFISGITLTADVPGSLTLGDRWLLARLAAAVDRATTLLEGYDYAAAKHEIESFFWRDLADNYLEMAKQRLYDGSGPGAQYVLQQALLMTLKLFAPFMPFVTEAIYRELFAPGNDETIHRSAWPVAKADWRDDEALADGELLVLIATSVRRFKSEAALALGAPLAEIKLAAPPALRARLAAGEEDLLSITRAGAVTWHDRLAVDAESWQTELADGALGLIVVTQAATTGEEGAIGRR